MSISLNTLRFYVDFNFSTKNKKLNGRKRKNKEVVSLALKF